MVAWVAQIAMSVLGAALLAALLFWAFRYLQYREQVRRSQARWLAYEPTTTTTHVFTTEHALGISWPLIAPAMLSPIPEERLESGRESETESIVAMRKDRRSNSVSTVAYGSFDQVTTV